jgi:hypothetical protein
VIIWSGWGILVGLVAIGVLALLNVAIDAALGTGFYAAHIWPKLVSWVLAGALSWPLARWLEARPGRMVVDKASGRELMLKPRHSLFFVPVRYWPFILAGIGILVSAGQLASGSQL